MHGLHYTLCGVFLARAQLFRWPLPQARTMIPQGGAMIYLDNAATSWPKPEAVGQAIVRTMDEAGGNPGRSGHRLSLKADQVVQQARQSVCNLFGIRDASRLVFTLNATWAINLALKGLLKAGDHVVCGSMEHNAVSRPLQQLQQAGVQVSYAPSSPQSGVSADAVAACLQPATRLVVLNHASNVCGTLNPVAEIGALCAQRGITFLVDAAQTAGSLPIDVVAMHIDLLAFPGHKGLLGPQGTGGLYIAPGLELATLAEGGTGSQSASQEQPLHLPDRFESGTPNTPGLAGLAAGIAYITGRGVAAIGKHETALCERLVGGVSGLPGLTVLGPSVGQPRAAAVAIKIKGMDPMDASAILDQHFGIACRAGLHCAPRAHQCLGTLPQGTLRFSPGPFSTEADIDACVAALRSVAGALA